ncbi:MAG: PspA/IM30 family protein [Pleurocapsa sp.]
MAIGKNLWGLPVEAGGKVTEKVAQESLKSMEESLVKLSTAVAKVVATYDSVQQQYNNKLEQFHHTEKQAQLAYQKGNEEAARLAMAKAIALEKILPQLSDRVETAQITMNKAKAKLRRETEKPEAYKLELKNLETFTEINQEIEAFQAKNYAQAIALLNRL